MKENDQIMALAKKQIGGYARALLEAIRDPIINVNTDGMIIDINGAMEQITNAPREKIIGIHFSSYFTDQDIAIKKFNEALIKGFSIDSSLGLRSRNGTSMDVLLSANVYKDAAGEIIGVLFVARDYTPIKKAILSMQEANKELESFSYSVSHDLRAPLRAIDGFSQMLEEDYAEKLDSEGKRIIATIRKNAQRMSNLIDDLLSFSRLGRQALDLKNTNMDHVVQTVTKDLMDAFPGRKIKWDIDSLPDAKADVSLIRQVWFNILSNAVKFTRKNEHAKIRISGHVKDGKSIYFVEDNGVGFDMKYADKLFGVFQRLHSASEFEGTGVGLAITERIIKRHGGRIWADAAVLRGATFYFELSA
jgi:PAS domain S-box-containing protein